MKSSIAVQAQGQPTEDDLERRAPLILELVWINILVATFAAVVLIAPALLALGGGDGALRPEVGGGSSPTVVFVFAVACLWWAVELVQGCADLPVLPRRDGGGADLAPGIVGPPVLRRAEPRAVIRAPTPLWHIDHGTAVSAVLFSPQDRRLKTRREDGAARAWDLAAAGRLVCALPDPAGDLCGRLESLAWAPDATRLFTGFADGTVCAWDTTSGLEVLRIDHGRPAHELQRACWLAGGVEEFCGGAGLVAVSPDKTMIATGAAGGGLRIWALA